MFDPARFQIEALAAAIRGTLATAATDGTHFAIRPAAIDHDGSRPHEDQMRQVCRGLP
jgi:hypothetical protein